MKPIFKTLGSLSFALFLLGALVVLLAVSTLMESAFGTPFAQKVFYQAGWFDIFLSLLAVNILFSALSRWPYKLHHTGFLITHAGILLLLLGSLMTRFVAVEGQMVLREGEKKNFMTQHEYQLAVRGPSNHIQLWDLHSLSPRSKKQLMLSHSDKKLLVEDIEEGVLFSSQIVDGGASAEKNRAVHFDLKSDLMKMNESFWLVENSSDPAFSRSVSIGMADIELKSGKPADVSTEARSVVSSGPELRVTQKSTGKTYSIPLSKNTGDKTFKELELTVSNVLYFPDARVGEQNKLVNSSEEARNPAVQLVLRDNKGSRENRTLFSLFPDFESIHGRKSEAFKDLEIELIIPKALSPGLVFYMPGDRWTYEALSKNGSLSGVVEIGEDRPTGWSDFTFRVNQIIDSAVLEKKVEVTGDPKKGDLGVKLSLMNGDKILQTNWVITGESTEFSAPEGVYSATISTKSADLPFELELVDFRKKDYPGTSNAASYESDVIMRDPVDRLKIEKTIWMNHPLDYKGYRVFQSSYSQDAMGGETSIFTIAKNPGIALIYGGSILMFIGIFCGFYVKPFSHLSAKGSHAAKK